ncbi:MAG TPA: hypothetical protein VJJ98_04745, partial [Sedimentisphaerales bacterium]|nr:hypothetical protein [Sedimentisphaerales bacterium]
SAAPPFSRRRHDDATTQNSTPHDGIHIHQEPIINIEDPPLAESIINSKYREHPRTGPKPSNISKRSAHPL